MMRSASTKQPPRPVRVAIAPYSLGNPYVASLASATIEAGAKLTWVRSGILSLLTAPGVWSADVIHFHWVDSYLLAGASWKTSLKSVVFLSCIRVLRLLGKRIVWTVHNLGSHYVPIGPRERSALNAFGAQCDRVLVHNDACRERVEQVIPATARGGVSVVRHANYVDSYPAPPAREQARAELGIPQDRVVFAFVGVMRSYKGVHDLIDAFRRADVGDALLLMRGYAPPEMEAELADKVDHPNIDCRFGWLDESAVSTTLAACDALVAPYREVFTSGSVLMAASFARAAIVPDVPTVVDSVTADGVITFDRGSVESLAEALEGAAVRPERLVDLGRRARRGVDGWGWGEMGEQTYRVYEAVLETGGGGRRASRRPAGYFTPTR